MIYGYDSRTINEYGLKQMREISIAVSPDDLRTFAQFLLHAADDLDVAASSHWHRHIPGTLERSMGCGIVVLNSKPDVRTKR